MATFVITHAHKELSNSWGYLFKKEIRARINEEPTLSRVEFAVFLQDVSEGDGLVRLSIEDTRGRTLGVADRPHGPRHSNVGEPHKERAGCVEETIAVLLKAREDGRLKPY